MIQPRGIGVFLRQTFAQRLAILLNAVGFCLECFSDRFHHVGLSGPAATRYWRKIRTAPKRLAIRGQKHG